MFDRPQTGTRAILVHIDFRVKEAQESLEEFRQLALSAAIEPVAVIRGTRAVPNPKYFVGSGKVEEILAVITGKNAQMVLFNHTLSPAQERNLEKHLNCRILDRTGLILEIFAQRAQSYEGKLQVELAQLRHLSTRLVRGWTHLERQKGGIGLRGGPGETQLESDRRLIAGRIKKLNKQLDKVRKQRDQRRKARHKAEVKTLSLVGYTNAGKSTLFNYLTSAGVYAADQLFATLDPTLRRIELPGAGHVVLADTVGFIRHLPHNLVAAFRATLEETVSANLLLHVIDAADDNHQACTEQVNEVLKEIGADSIPQLEIYNKIDLLENTQPHIDRDEEGRPQRVWLTARTGAGMDLLRQALTEYLLGKFPRSDDVAGIKRYTHGKQGLVTKRLHLLPGAGKLYADLSKWGIVIQEFTDASGGWIVDVEVSPELLDYLSRQEGCFIESGEWNAASNA